MYLKSHFTFRHNGSLHFGLYIEDEQLFHGSRFLSILNEEPFGRLLFYKIELNEPVHRKYSNAHHY
jgi:hypothetical protein